MKVLIFPKSTNPYLELLYREMRSAHPDDAFSYFEATPRNMLLFPVLAALKRLRGYKVFHLHWPLFYIAPGRNLPLSKLLSFIYSMVCLSSLKLLGYKVVWTVHNVVPHEQATSNDLLVTKYLARIAARKIAHSTSTIAELEEKGVSTKNCTIIPHGSYVDVYPDNITRTEARKKLGVKGNESVILLLGVLNPYKGIDDLIAAYARLEAKNVRLMIVGKCNDESLKKRILAAKKDYGVDYRDGYIADEDIATYFNAADIACTPFQKVTTSGSALLALSFGKPVVAPNIGALTDLPSNVGYLYDPAQKDALFTHLQKAVGGRKLPLLSKNAKAYAATLSWKTIATKTYKTFTSL